MNQKQLWECLDACRPSRDDSQNSVSNRDRRLSGPKSPLGGSPTRDESPHEIYDGRDLDLPEFAELRQELSSNSQLRAAQQRIVRIDRELTRAVQNVPAPAGLADRILQAVHAAQAAAAATPLRSTEPGVVVSTATAPIATDASSGAENVLSSESADQAAGHAAVGTTNRPVGVGISRRNLLAAATSLAASIAVAAVLWPTDPAPLSESEIVENAAQWNSQLEAQATWQSMSLFPVERYSLSSSVAGNLRRWTDASRVVGRSAVACEISSGPALARLFIVETLADTSYSAPPLSALASTQNVSIACWQPHRLLYVLVVDGGDADYRRFIAVPTLTRRPPTQRFELAAASR